MQAFDELVSELVRFWKGHEQHATSDLRKQWRFHLNGGPLDGQIRCALNTKRQPCVAVAGGAKKQVISGGHRIE